MKPITQDRILAVLDKLSNYRDKVVFLVSEHICAIDVDPTLEQINAIDLDLSLQWVRFSKIKNLAEWFVEREYTYYIRCAKVLDIQVYHNVSSLVWQHIEPTFVTCTFRFPFFSKKLRPIARDLEVLAKYKGSVIQYWVDCAPKLELVACYLTDGVWIPISFDKVWEKSSKFEWANISLDEYYVSPSIIDHTGYDKPRCNPEMDDDELHIEFHLAIGRGLDYDSDNADVLNFMLVKQVPTYC
jgi:hypothetical protein